MTRNRIRARQNDTPPLGLRMVRVTVDSVSPLTVLLPGATTSTAAIPVPGVTYATGDRMLALYQEPAVLHVLPLS